MRKIKDISCVVILENGTRTNLRREEEIPNLGQKIKLGGTEYEVIGRKMPLLTEWKKYNLKPPMIWVRNTYR